MIARLASRLPIAALAGLAALGALGCGLPLSDGDAEVVNACESDADCGSGAACYQEQFCVSTKSDLSGVILQVDIPSGAAYGQGTSHLIDPAAAGKQLSGTQAGGYIISFDLEPPVVSEVTVGMVVNQSQFEDCAGAAMEVQLDPVGMPSGIALTSYKTAVEDGPQMASDDATGRLLMEDAVLRVPSGTYDIYVRPAPGPDGKPSCDLPPTVLQDRAVDGVQLTVDIEGGVPEIVTGVIEGYDVEKLTGWTIDIVENRRGRIISTQHEFQGESTSFTLQYWPQLMDEEALDAVVRLQPKEADSDRGIPKLFYKLEALDIFGTGVVPLDLSELAGAQPVEVDGQVAATADGSLVPAQLVVRSTELLGGQLSGTASYRTSLETDAEGAFSLSLLPGKYDVVALPTNDIYAVTVDELTILSGSDQGGKTIEVDDKRTLVGLVQTAQQPPMAAPGLPVLLSPTSPEATTFLKSELDDGTISTNASTTTGGDGGFSVELDPGEYNLSVQPEPSSNLPWAVLSRLNIPAVESQSVPNLTVTISNPVLMRGIVRDPAGDPIPNARVRAWLAPPKLNSDDESEPSVLQVADTTSLSAPNGDDHGSYSLLLPASITASTSQ